MKTIGKYSIIKEIGTGGFGTVYLVQYKDDRYALKQLSGGVLDVDVSERFIRESLRVEEIRKTHHIDYLVRIEEVLIGEKAFVMEYIPEGSPKYMRRTGDHQFIRLLIAAMLHLHQIGVAHRDVKPENLRVKNGKPVLIDFGVASWWDSRSNVVPVGTKYYSPPEMMSIFPRYRDLRAARRAFRQLADICPHDAVERIKLIKKSHDVYSLGITVGQLLTGALPFAGDTYRDYLDSGTCDVLEQWLSRIPRPFDDFVRGAVTFYPQHRPPLERLRETVDIEAPVHTSPIRFNLPGLSVDAYRCLECERTTPPPANFCPYCAADLRYIVFQIKPIQEIETHTLPASITIINPTTPQISVISHGNHSSECRKTSRAVQPWQCAGNHAETSDVGSWPTRGTMHRMVAAGGIFLIIDLSGPDFSVNIGRRSGKNHISFPEDNSLSGLQGQLIKESKRIFYRDGGGDHPPTNSAVINNIPVGTAPEELHAGTFMVLGSTVFNIRKYFGNLIKENVS